MSSDDKEYSTNDLQGFLSCCHSDGVLYLEEDNKSSNEGGADGPGEFLGLISLCIEEIKETLDLLKNESKKASDGERFYKKKLHCFKILKNLAAKSCMENTKINFLKFIKKFYKYMGILEKDLDNRKGFQEQLN